MSTNDKLKSINTEAALAASSALCKMIGQPVNLRAINTSVIKSNELGSLFEREAVVAATYLPITGDVRGAALLIFTEASAIRLAELLLKKEPGTTKKLSELGCSALQEVGNIICGNYLTVLSNALQAKIVEHVPHFSLDMFGAIMEQVISQFAGDAERAVVVAIEFTTAPVTFTGHLVLLFEFGQIEAVLEPERAVSG